MSSILPDPFRSHRYGVKSFGQRSRKSQFADPEGDFGQSSTRPSQLQWIRRGALVVLLLGAGGLLVFLIRPGKASAVATFTTETPSARPAGSSVSALPQEEPAAATWQGPRPIEVARALIQFPTQIEAITTASEEINIGIAWACQNFWVSSDSLFWVSGRLACGRQTRWRTSLGRLDNFEI